MWSGDHLLQPRVLFLQGLQLLGHLWFHATILLPPAIIGLFGNFRRRLLATYKFRAPSSPCRFQNRLTKSGNNLIHCVTFLRHCESPFQAVRPIKIRSLTIVQFYGGRSFPLGLTWTFLNLSLFLLAMFGCEQKKPTPSVGSKATQPVATPRPP